MKVFIFALLLAIGSTKEFKVQKDGKTCALLKLAGTLELTATQQETLVGKVDLQFDQATLITNSSSCELIKLDLGKSAEVWFQFDKSEKNWKVTPESTFVPETVFGKDVNETDAVVMEANPLEQFPQGGYYKCKSSSQLMFSTKTEFVDFNYTVTATVSDFQTQSVEGDDFKKAGKECAADAKPQEYMCKDGNNTLIMMEGNFTLQIAYLNSKGANVTETIVVPGPEDAVTKGDCQAKAKTESLSINFFDSWAVDFTFAQEAKGNYYSISNITVTFDYDTHLPDHAENGTRTVVLPIKENYLKASTKGYYICDSKLDKSNNGVTLSSKNFKYRAFDEKSAGFDGDVSECSGDMDSSSVVPIAVGAALAGLVVIVLVAYLIGRKRTRKTGYESV